MAAQFDLVAQGRDALRSMAGEVAQSQFGIVDQHGFAFCFVWFRRRSYAVASPFHFGYDRNMDGIATIAELAALIGDPARANMLFALKADGTVSAGDLTGVANVAPSTASEHLAKLAAAGLVRMTAKGRMRYYSLADPAVAELLDGVESLAGLLSGRARQPRQWDRAETHSRCCLDHLAGRLGGDLAGAAVARGYLRLAPRGPQLTGAGTGWLAALGVDAGSLRAGPRKLLRLCPDWTGEAPHIGGAVGAAILRGLIGADWLRRPRGARHVVVTPKGAAGFRREFGLDLRPPTE